MITWAKGSEAESGKEKTQDVHRRKDRTDKMIQNKSLTFNLRETISGCKLSLECNPAILNVELLDVADESFEPHIERFFWHDHPC